MALVKFYAGTLANYQALETKDAGALYFITDSTPPLLYKGDTLYTKSWTAVDALPESNQIQGVLYLNATDGAIYSWNGTKWTAVTRPATGTITEGSTDLATAGAVYTAIQNAVKDLTGGSVLVKNVEASETAGKIKVTTGGGASEFAVKGVVVNPTYEAATRTITFPYADGTESLVINLGKDLVVASGSYNSVSQEIELTLTSGDIVKIPVSKLVDVYTGGQTGTVSVAVSDGKVVTATVRLAAAGESEHNDLVARDDGLFVDVQTPVAAAINTAAGDATTKANKALEDAKAYVDGKLGATETGKTIVEQIAEVKTLAQKGVDDAATAQAAAEAAQASATENKGLIDTINGDENTAGSIKKAKADAVADAKTYTDTALTWQTI